VRLVKNDIDEDTSPGTPKAKKSLTDLNALVSNLGVRMDELQERILVFQTQMAETISSKVADAVSIEMNKLIEPVSTIANIVGEVRIVVESLIARCQNLEDRVEVLERESSTRITMNPNPPTKET
jgi:predicted  nucleic acid-binding Zn-ribbon protein